MRIVEFLGILISNKKLLVQQTIDVTIDVNFSVVDRMNRPVWNQTLGDFKWKNTWTLRKENRNF